MDDLTKLKTAFSLIVIGLYEKERQKKEGKYYYMSDGTLWEGKTAL